MKKILAVLLAVLAMLALVSCGAKAPSVKKPKSRVKAAEFYEELFDALSLDDDDVFERDFKATAGAESTSTTKKDIQGGKTVKSSEKSEGVMKMEFDENNEIYRYERNTSASESSLYGKASEEYERSACYFQKGDDYVAIDSLQKSYVKYEDDENGVIERATDDLASALSDMIDDVIKFSLVGLGDFDNIDDLLNFDDDVKVLYYIDKNVYTVVYTAEREDEDNDTTVTTDITIQIVVEDDGFTCVREEKKVTERDHRSYDEVTTDETTYFLNVKFDGVELKKPDLGKYAEIKAD